MPGHPPRSTLFPPAPLFGSTFAGGVNTATTNAQGVASAPVFTANAAVGGPYTVTASASGIATPANFSLTNLAAPPGRTPATTPATQSATLQSSATNKLQHTA